MINRADRTESVYGTRSFPDCDAMHWVLSASGDSRSYFLARSGSATPITFWIVGKVTAAFFFDSKPNGDPPASCSIQVTPVDHGGLIKANEILRTFSTVSNPSG